MATFHGGIPEAVTDGRDGLLVPEKSPGALAEAVLRVITSDGLLESLSSEALRSVTTKYGPNGCLQALEDCYAEVIRTS